jgi:ComF family protein
MKTMKTFQKAIQQSPQQTMKQLHQMSFNLIPARCVLCSRPTNRNLDLCLPCESDMPWIGNHCRYCSLPVDSIDYFCSNCLRSRPEFSAALCAFEYRFPIDALIHRFKEARHLASGHVLMELAIRRLNPSLYQLAHDGYLITPVPLHRSKLRKRGYNQSAIFAAYLASYYDAVYEPTLLTRTKITVDQKLLNHRTRSTNLRNAFSVNRSVRSEKIIVVDDVITTTATVSEVTSTLYKGGAQDVVVVALARTASAAS